MEANDKRAKKRKLTASSPNTPPVFISTQSSGGYLSDSESDSICSDAKGRSTSDPESPLFQPSYSRSVPRIIEIPSETSDCGESDQSFLTMPPHCKTMGRHKQELVHIFKSEKKKLCDPSARRISDTIYVFLFRLSTKQYVLAHSIYCSSKHQTACHECEVLLAVCRQVLKCGYAKLSECFKSSFPNQTYKADLARQ